MYIFRAAGFYNNIKKYQYAAFHTFPVKHGHRKLKRDLVFDTASIY